MPLLVSGRQQTALSKVPREEDRSTEFSKLRTPYQRRLARLMNRLPVLLFLALYLFPSAIVLPQDLSHNVAPPEQDCCCLPSRAELWKSLRLAKADQLEPERLSRTQRTLLFLEQGGLEQILFIRYKDFYPRFGSLTEGSGVGFGVRYYKPEIFGRDISIESTFLNTFKNYRQLDFHFGRFDKIAPDFFVGPPDFGTPFRFGEPDPREIRHRRFLFYGRWLYRYFPDEDFFGLGNESSRHPETPFLLEQFTSEVVGGYLWKPWLATAARVGHHNYSVEPTHDRRPRPSGSPLDPTVLPGLAEQPDLLSAELAVLVNRTDRPGNPHSGVATGLSWIRYWDRETGGRQVGFHRLSLDSRWYVPLLSEQRILALNLQAARTYSIGKVPVPFYLMSTVGGPDRLRGYESYRFRDNDLLYFSTEYRWEPAPAWELALFYDTGRVFTDGDWVLEGFHSGIGFGTRFKTAKRTFLRLDYARGHEEWRFHVRFGPAF